MKNINCVICKKEFQHTNKHKILCLECYEKNRQISAKKYYEKNKLIINEKAKIVSKKCRTEIFVNKKINKKKRINNVSGKEDFFMKWNEESSYIRGLIVADGCISISPNNRYKHLRIVLTDKDVIEKIVFVLGEKIKICINKGMIKKNGETGKTQYGIIISNIEFIQPLIDFGICPNKTYNMPEVSIPDGYFWSFLRCFTDGDGCIKVYQIKNKGKYLICLNFVCGSYVFVNWLKNQLSNKTGTNINLYKDKKYHCWSINLYNKNASFCLKNMYENSKIHMDRRYKKYLLAKEKRPDLFL